MGDEKVRLRISIKKTKLLKVCDPEEGTADISDEPNEEVDSFQYPGSIVASEDWAEKDHISWIGKASSIFQASNQCGLLQHLVGLTSCTFTLL